MTLVLSLLAACLPSPLDPDVESTLDPAGAGCGDTYVYTSDADDAVALFFEVDARADEVCDGDAPLTTTYTLPDPAVSLVLQQGAHLTAGECLDYDPDVAVSVDRTWEAISGTATLVRTARDGFPCEAGDSLYDATLTLTEVVFSDGDAQVTIEAFSVTAQVGWYAG